MSPCIMSATKVTQQAHILFWKDFKTKKALSYPWRYASRVWIYKSILIYIISNPRFNYLIRPLESSSIFIRMVIILWHGWQTITSSFGFWLCPELSKRIILYRWFCFCVYIKKSIQVSFFIVFYLQRMLISTSKTKAGPFLCKKWKYMFLYKPKRNVGLNSPQIAVHKWQEWIRGVKVTMFSL